MKKKTADDSALHTGDENDQCEHVGFRYKKTSIKIHLLQTGETEWLISCRIATNNSGYGFGMSNKSHVYNPGMLLFLQPYKLYASMPKPIWIMQIQMQILNTSEKYWPG